VPAHDDEARRIVATEWDAAMTHVGFAFIVGHGVDPNIISELRDSAMNFFLQDEETKKFYNHGPYGNPFGGYTGMNSEAVSQTRDGHGSDGGGGNGAMVVPDLVESFVFKPESTMPKPPLLEKTGLAYHAALLQVLSSLHELTAASLGLPSDFFVPYYAPHTSPRRCRFDCPTIPRYHQNINFHWLSGTVNILITLVLQFYIKMSLTLVILMLVDCKSNCQMETGMPYPQYQVHLLLTLVICTRYGRMDDGNQLFIV
jgi:isopenicillin N synthase-like dioxygenase